MGVIRYDTMRLSDIYIISVRRFFFLLASWSWSWAGKGSKRYFAFIILHHSFAFLSVCLTRRSLCFFFSALAHVSEFHD